MPPGAPLAREPHSLHEGQDPDTVHGEHCLAAVVHSSRRPRTLRPLPHPRPPPPLECPSVITGPIICQSPQPLPGPAVVPGSLPPLISHILLLPRPVNSVSAQSSCTVQPLPWSHLPLTPLPPLPRSLLEPPEADTASYSACFNPVRSQFSDHFS